MWVKARNGNVLDLPEDQADICVAQGLRAFESEDDARAFLYPEDEPADGEQPEDEPADGEQPEDEPADGEQPEPPASRRAARSK